MNNGQNKNTNLSILNDNQIFDTSDFIKKSVDNYKLNDDVLINEFNIQKFRIKLLKYNSDFATMVKNKWVWFIIFATDKNWNTWQLNVIYNKDTKRFNIVHRLVSKKSPLRWFQLFDIIQNFIVGILENFWECKWFEISVRQADVLWRSIDKLWFIIDYEQTNELWKLYLQNPHDHKLKTISVYIKDKDHKIDWAIVASGYYENNDIITNFNWVVNIVCNKNFV